MQRKRLSSQNGCDDCDENEQKGSASASQANTAEPTLRGSVGKDALGLHGSRSTCCCEGDRVVSDYVPASEVDAVRATSAGTRESGLRTMGPSLSARCA